MSVYDPLLELEKNLEKKIESQVEAQIQIQKQSKKQKIKISRFKTVCSTHCKTFGQRFLGFLRFLFSYTLVTGLVFAVLMTGLNYSAYSARIVYWFNPHVYAQSSESVQDVISRSNSQIDGMDQSHNDVGSRFLIEQKIAEKNPEMIYSRNYGVENLLSNIPVGSSEKASFSVTPYENRIIIPRLGKNIPLIDVSHDEGTALDKMHEVFMEELKKGIVRYPGTAKPGEKGNAFIFGHSSNFPWIPSKYNDVFALLDTLKNGDEIIVYYNQKQFIYKVTDRSVVYPGDNKVLDKRDPNKREISLMTCWPIGSTDKRLIIFGELVEENAL